MVGDLGMVAALAISFLKNKLAPIMSSQNNVEHNANSSSVE